ncbi:MAG: hypothetical protein U0Y68_23400 [Blastocatellia bacterium]
MKKIMASFAVIAFLTGMSTLTSVSFAQQHHEHAPASIAGTWDMNMSSHQVALVLKQDGKKVTATLMMPGKDLALEGEYTEGTLTLTTAASESGAPQMKLTGKLQEDGTLAGDSVSPRGKATWTAERLKQRG